MTKLQCTKCGGRLILNVDGNSSECENCGLVYTDETIEKMLVEISGGKVEVEGVATTNNLIKHGDDMMCAENYQDAYISYKEATKQDPYCYSAWYGISRLALIPCDSYRADNQFGIYYVKAKDYPSTEFELEPVGIISIPEAKLAFKKTVELCSEDKRIEASKWRDENTDCEYMINKAIEERNRKDKESKKFVMKLIWSMIGGGVLLVLFGVAVDTLWLIIPGLIIGGLGIAVAKDQWF